MTRQEQIEAVEKIIKKKCGYPKLYQGVIAVPCTLDLATAIVEAIGLNKNKVYDILFDLCDSDCGEAIMYSEAQAIALATNKEVIEIKGDDNDKA